MSFQPIIGQGGYTGWKLLSRTSDMQKTMVARDPMVARDNDYFRKSIGQVETADDLVSDYRLLRTALSAFGLEADQSNRFFIRKVLESDLSDSKSLANRLGDRRYRAFAEAFGLGEGGKRASDLANTVTQRHVDAELESRVGTLDGNLRLAMHAKRELSFLGSSSSSETTLWYNILGSTPLLKVVQGALGLGTQSSKLPIERQVEEMAARTQKMFGSSSPATFADPKNLDKLISRFLIRAEAVTGPQSSYNAALALLRH